MLRRAWVLTLLTSLALCASCAKKPAQPRRAITGPAVLAKTERGYELKNRWQRVLIDDKTGDATYWASISTDRNLLLPPGVIARMEDAPDVVPDGYVEMRDDQTWQYIGEDPDVGWRKIYCLEEDSLYVTYIVQNLRKDPRTFRIALRPNFAGMRMSIAGTDTLAGKNAFGRVWLQAFNVTPQPPAKQPSQLLSDTHTLKPGERISFTTQWRLSRIGG